MKYEQLIGKSSGLDSLPVVMKNFSVGSLVKVNDVPTNISFSENPVAATDEYVTKCFSLLERIKLSNMRPKQILKRRINEVIRYAKSNDAAKIKANKGIIIRYLSEYVYQIIMSLLNDPNVSKINLIMILGLSSILENMSTIEELQTVLRKAKMELDSHGSITKTIQTKLSAAYAKFWTEFLFTLEEKYFSEDKKGTLVRREKGLFVQ
jgi:hypothetical protein